MNRRQFFTAAPAMLAAPIVPKPEEDEPLAGTISIFNGKTYIPVGRNADERFISKVRQK